MPQFIFVDYCQISTIDMLRYVFVDKMKIKDLLGKDDTALSSILRKSDFNEGLTTFVMRSLRSYLYRIVL